MHIFINVLSVYVTNIVKHKRQVLFGKGLTNQLLKASNVTRPRIDPRIYDVFFHLFKAQ